MSAYSAKCELRDFLVTEILDGREDAIPVATALANLIEQYVVATIEESTGGAP